MKERLIEVEDNSTTTAYDTAPVWTAGYCQPVHRVTNEHIDKRRGSTPNPCIVCNHVAEIRRLFDYADNIGADFVAPAITPGWFRCPTAKARCAVFSTSRRTSPSCCSHPAALAPTVMFPVRPTSQSRRFGGSPSGWALRVAAKRDSQEICFVPTRTMPDLSGSIAAVGHLGRRSSRPTARWVGRHDGSRAVQRRSAQGAAPWRWASRAMSCGSSPTPPRRARHAEELARCECSAEANWLRTKGRGRGERGEVQGSGFRNLNPQNLKYQILRPQISKSPSPSRPSQDRYEPPGGSHSGSLAWRAIPRSIRRTVPCRRTWSGRGLLRWRSVSAAAGSNRARPERGRPARLVACAANSSPLPAFGNKRPRTARRRSTYGPNHDAGETPALQLRLSNARDQSEVEPQHPDHQRQNEARPMWPTRFARLVAGLPGCPRKPAARSARVENGNGQEVDHRQIGAKHREQEKQFGVALIGLLRRPFDDSPRPTNPRAIPC